MLGLDTLADRYAYAEDPVAGYTAAKRVPDRWVPTTCGYCSVGCGMFIGVKDGRANAATTLRSNRLQIRNRAHRLARCRRQALHYSQPDSHSGERTWTAGRGEAVDGIDRCAMASQQCFDFREQQIVKAVRGVQGHLFQNLTVARQGDASKFG